MKKKRVFIVEDEAITLMDQQQMMHDMGYEVAGVTFSGEMAIQEINDIRPDVVLMDIRLSGKMDGSEAAQKIRESHNIPVIFVTALGDKKMSISGKYNVSAGYGYVVKPYTKKELQNEIERVLP